MKTGSLVADPLKDQGSYALPTPSRLEYVRIAQQLAQHINLCANEGNLFVESLSVEAEMEFPKPV